MEVVIESENRFGAQSGSQSGQPKPPEFRKGGEIPHLTCVNIHFEDSFEGDLKL
jgi:hypothetical protein